VDVLAVIAGGSWGAVAGAMLLALLAAALGAPTGTGAGELIPGFGWNRLTAFVIGLPIGFAGGAMITLRAARRWPWLVGLPMAIVGVLVIVTSLADRSQWDTTFYLLIVPVVPGAACLTWYLRRRSRTG
jgi:hypothetical protein